MALIGTNARRSLRCGRLLASPASTRGGLWARLNHTVAITGAGGELGSILRRQLAGRGLQVVAVEREKMDLSDVVECREADFAGPAGHGAVEGVLEGCDSVIHLAALPKPWESYANVMAANMVGDQLFFEEAARAGCKRFVYASTNHVQHGATTRTTPETLDSDKFGAHVQSADDLIGINDPPVPDSFYAVSKLNGENLGRLYARDKGLEVIATRIGWVVPEADPRDSKWVETPDHHEYMRCMYLGHSDCEEVFHRAATMDLAGGEHDLGKLGGKFAMVYAVSNNSRRVFDLSCTEGVLGYTPQQNAETFFAAS